MRKSIVYIGLLSFGILVGFAIQPLISKGTIFNQEEKFIDVLNKATKNYVEDVDKDKLVEAAIKGMLNELDPHSVYISADEMKRVNEDFQGSFDGIGVEFDIINDTLTVVTPIPGGPSEALGIMAGDQIMKIDTFNAIGISRSEVPKRLKGPKGTIVQVQIKRHGHTDLLNFSITRDKIPLYSVDASFVDDETGIGVVIVNRFSATTHQELREALYSLKQQGMKKLILDLRHNPGGYLNQAFLMADDFIKAGDTIVYTKGRRPEFNEAFIGSPGGEFENIPLIVMVNAGSASASEIVSGAIQDLDRGLVVGETSFGKGLVQRQYDLGDGSAFRLTISKYYTPSGRCIQRPYKDKDKYRSLGGRIELADGNYIEHPLDIIKKQVDSVNKTIKDPKDKINIDSLPIYKTRSGRVVFGGGGVVPDYIIQQDTITHLSVNIRRKNLFFEYVNNYLNNNGNSLKENYKERFNEFLHKYNVSNDMISEFKKLVESKDIKWSDSDYKTDETFIKTTLKSMIAKNIWDRNKSTQVFLTVDPQLQKAKALFPEAIKVSKMRK